MLFVLVLRIFPSATVPSELTTLTKSVFISTLFLNIFDGIVDVFSYIQSALEPDKDASFIILYRSSVG